MTEFAKPCCSPSRAEGPAQTLSVELGKPQRADAIDIPGGVALVGTAHPRIADDGRALFERCALSCFSWVGQQ